MRNALKSGGCSKRFRTIPGFGHEIRSLGFASQQRGSLLNFISDAGGRFSLRQNPLLGFTEFSHCATNSIVFSPSVDHIRGTSTIKSTGEHPGISNLPSLSHYPVNGSTHHSEQAVLSHMGLWSAGASPMRNASKYFYAPPSSQPSPGRHIPRKAMILDEVQEQTTVVSPSKSKRGVMRTKELPVEPPTVHPGVQARSHLATGLRPCWTVSRLTQHPNSTTTDHSPSCAEISPLRAIP